MTEREAVLAVFESATEPLNATTVAKLSGLDKKAVDKVFTQLKKEEVIVSPVRCKWELKK
ncbi:MAG: transcriptional regulator [Erysipelotrichaceae bacterium]|nr:transcriptional regulator [Erysipelotrichaceae bacterium]